MPLSEYALKFSDEIPDAAVVATSHQSLTNPVLHIPGGRVYRLCKHYLCNTKDSSVELLFKDLERLRSDFEKRQAELERAESEKHQAVLEKHRAVLEKRQAVLETQRAESEKQRAEYEKRQSKRHAEVAIELQKQRGDLLETLISRPHSKREKVAVKEELRRINEEFAKHGKNLDGRDANLALHKKKLESI
ncbi:hypothetical protein BDR26DRAFT_879725, partial [Obelidium mucronatum]